MASAWWLNAPTYQGLEYYANVPDAPQRYHDLLPSARALGNVLAIVEVQYLPFDDCFLRHPPRYSNHQLRLLYIKEGPYPPNINTWGFYCLESFDLVPDHRRDTHFQAPGITHRTPLGLLEVKKELAKLAVVPIGTWIHGANTNFALISTRRLFASVRVNLRLQQLKQEQDDDQDLSETDSDSTPEP